MADTSEHEFSELLDYLKRTRGFDFTTYKRPSLMRRIGRHMQTLNLATFADYTDYLEVHPDEFEHLFNLILINVTAFFRDDQSWQFIKDDVIPQIVSRAPEESIRVWTAGCASGEETYSIAMLLGEAVGRDQFRDRVKIYATDVDDQALNQARAAAYTEKQIADVPQDLRKKYFVREGDRHVFDRDLRRSIIFGRHDLIQDAPISRVNLLICRNTLMYFNTEAQGRVLARFHFALAESGVLFLGKAEMLLSHTQLFAPIDLRRRVFRKVPKEHWRERMATMNQASGDEAIGLAADDPGLYPAALDASPQAQFVVDNNGLLALFNERARTLFSFTPSDLGRPIQDLEISSRPVALGPLVSQVADHKRSILCREVSWDSAGGDVRFYDVHLAAVNGHNARPLGVSVSFVDVSRVQNLQIQLNRANQDLETAYEELQSTNEELETTNEELQSTVEELETTNEELQSTNEELQTINEELRDRGYELNNANGFLESILAGVRNGVIVLDREFRVMAWNHRSEDLWGLRADEAKGQNFLNLDIGFPADTMRPAVRSCLAGESNYQESIVPATNRRGKPISCKVITTPLTTLEREISGAILLIDEQPGSPARLQ